MEWIDALSCFAILEGFDMSCLPKLGVSRQYDDLLTTRFDSSSGSHLLNFSYK